MTAHPRARLDDLVHQPVRFSLLAGLAQADELEFRFLRDTLQISDSLLSRQASTLEQAGYIAIRKGHVGKWPRTWLKLTPEGRTAFNDHLDTLREIVETPTVLPSDSGQNPERPSARAGRPDPHLPGASVGFSGGDGPVVRSR